MISFKNLQYICEVFQEVLVTYSDTYQILEFIQTPREESEGGIQLGNSYILLLGPLCVEL